MANIRSVAKRARQADKRRERNTALRSKLRTAKKKISSVIVSGDKEAVAALTPETLRLYDKMVSKGIIHKGNAARNKSRLMLKVRSIIEGYQVPTAVPKEEIKAE
jgi:small subunit ribosomal protein S20